MPPSTETENEETQKPDISVDKEETKPETNIIYATKLEIKGAKTITIQVGCFVELETGYMLIEPANTTCKMITTISPLYTSVEDGIDFENNKITANKIGHYRIDFKILKAENKYIETSLRIDVVDDKFSTNKSTFTVGETFPISDFITINDNYENLQLKTNNYVSLNDNNLTAISAGDTVLTVSYSKEFIKYFYDFNIKVKNIPEYYIVIDGLSNNCKTVNLSDEYAMISFKVYDKYNQHALQSIDVFIENDSVAEKVHVTYPLIKFKLMQAGETKIQISLNADAEIFMFFTLIVQ